MSAVDEITPVDLKARIDRGERPFILDVREPEEVALAAFPDATNIPMGELPARMSELDPDRETIIVCHHGIRSAQVAIYLARMGFQRAVNLTGGIDAWSAVADPAVPRY